MYLLSKEQRDVLLEYLMGRPYREVASGIEFLLNLPEANNDSSEQVVAGGDNHSIANRSYGSGGYKD